MHCEEGFSLRVREERREGEIAYADVVGVEHCARGQMARTRRYVRRRRWRVHACA